jgi:CIC family chloride channel protein
MIRRLSILTLLGIVVGGVVGVLAVGFVEGWMQGHRFHRLQDVIEIAHSPNPSMPVRQSALTSLAAFLSLGAGASVGQYGPLAHMGAAIGSWTGRILRGDRSMGVISIACGCAAAISAAFHAPIAGLVFAREVVLRHYSLRAFAPIAVASILGYVVAHIVFKRVPLFRVEALTIASPLEYFLFIAIGITGAVLATAFMRGACRAD